MKRTVLFFALLAIAATTFGQVKVNSNGNVGIGTDNPAHKLDVFGNIRFAQWNGTWEAIRIDWNNQYGSAQVYCNTDFS
jgi:hypothetical protein